MATDADTPDPISLLKREDEDKEMKSGLSNITVSEGPQEEKKIIESRLSQPLEIIEILGKTEIEEVANGDGVANMNAINKGIVETIKGDVFSKSPSVADEKSEKYNEDSQTMSEDDIKNKHGSSLLDASVEGTTSEKAGPDVRECVEENMNMSCKEGSNETVESSKNMKDLTSVEDEVPNKNLESSFTQKVVDFFFHKADNLDTSAKESESGKKDIVKESQHETENENEILENIVTVDSNQSTTGMHNDIYDTKADFSFGKTRESTERKNEDLTPTEVEENMNMPCKEASNETVEPSEKMKDSTSVEDEVPNKNLESSFTQKVVDFFVHKVDNLDTSAQESESGMKDIVKESQHDAENETETLENIVTADSDQSKTGMRDDIHDSKADVSFRQPTESTERQSEDLTPTEVLRMKGRHEGDMSATDEDNIVGEEQEKTETSTHEEQSGQSHMQKTEGSNMYAETITDIEEQTPVGSPEEILVEQIKDETIIADDIDKKEIQEAENLPPVDLDEKTRNAEFDIPNKSGSDSYITHPLIGEEVHMGGEKQDEVSMSESGDPPEAIKKPNEEEKHINETFEATKSPQITFSEHTATEGTLNIEVTSTSERVINIEKGFELKSEEALKEINAGNIEEDREQIENTEFLIERKSDDNERSAIEENIPVKIRTPLCSGEDEYGHDQEEKVRSNSFQEEFTETDGGDHNDITSNEVCENPKISDRGEGIEKVMKNEETPGTDYSQESTGQCTTKRSHGNELEAKKQKAEETEGYDTYGASTTLRESAITDLPSSYVQEEEAEKSLKENARNAMISDKEVWISNIECRELDFNATHVTGEGTTKDLKNEAEANAGLNTQSTTGSSSTEAAPKESNLNLIQNSSVPEIIEKEVEREILEKEDSKDTVEAEETRSTEAEAKYPMRVDSSNLISEEKGEVTTETSETRSNGIDIIAEPAEISILGDKKDTEIPTASKDGADEATEKTDPESKNETCDELSKPQHQREIVTVETSLDDVPEQDLLESSSMSLEPQNLVTEVIEAIGGAPEKDITLDVKEETPLIAETTEEVKREILEKEDSKDKVEAEETRSTEAEAEYPTRVDSSNLMSEDKGEVTTETSETASNGIDIIAEPTEIFIFSDKKDMDIPTATKDGADEATEKTHPESKNEPCDELSKPEHQREIATVETSLDDVPEQDLLESSSMPLEARNLVTEVIEATGEAPEKDKTFYPKEETPLVAETTEEYIAHKDDEPTNQENDTNTGSIDVGRESAIDDAWVEERELHAPLELNNGKSISESDVELLKGVNAEAANGSKIGKLDTSGDEKSSYIRVEEDKSEYEETVNAANEGIEVGGECIDTEKAILEQEDSTKNFERSSKEGVESEAHSYGSENSETQTISTQTENKRDVEDKELTNELPNVTVNEVPLEEKKHTESWLSQPPETTEILETECMQVAHNFEVGKVNVVNKRNVGSTEGDFFLKSPSITDKKLTKTTEDDPLNTKEEMSVFQEEKAELVTNRNIIMEASYGQGGVRIPTPEVTEGSSRDFKMLEEVLNKENNMENVIRTKTTSIEQDLKETSFEGEAKKSNTSSSSMGLEMELEATQPSTGREDKNKVEEMLYHGVNDVCIPNETESQDNHETDYPKESNVGATDKLGSSLVNAPIEETSSAKVGPDVCTNLEENSSTACEDEIQETGKLNERMKDDASIDEVQNQNLDYSFGKKVENFETSKEESETGVKETDNKTQDEVENQNETLANITIADSILSKEGEDNENPERKAHVAATKPEDSATRESGNFEPAKALTMECERGVMVVPGEDYVVVKEQATTKTSKHEEHSEQSLKQNNEPAKANLGSPSAVSSVISEEFETTSVNDYAETLTKIEERPEVSPQEILGETITHDDINEKEITEAKNLSTVDVGEKPTSAEVQIAHNNFNELHVTHTPVEESFPEQDENQTVSMLESEKQDRNETSKHEEHSDQSLMHNDGTAKATLGSPSIVALEEFETTTRNEHAESITDNELERPVGIPEENVRETEKDVPMIADDINNKEIPEAESLSAVGLDDKTRSAEVKIPINNGDEVCVTHPPAEETFLEGGEKQNVVSILEAADQVHDASASEVPKDEENQANDSYEATKSPECNILEHTSTEGAINTEVTSTRSAKEIPIESREEILGETRMDETMIADDINNKGIPEAEGLSAVDLDDKTRSAEVMIPINNDDEVSVTHPPTEETLAEGGNKQNVVSMSESGDQVPSTSATEVPKDEETQANDSNEATKSPEWKILEHTSTEGAVNTEVTSTRSAKEIPIESQEEILEETRKDETMMVDDINNKGIPEAKSLSAVDWDEKTRRAEVKILHNNIDEVSVIHPPVEETVPEGGEKQSEVSMLVSADQVHEESTTEVPKDKENQDDDSYEATKSFQCKILEHASTEGAVNTEGTSTRSAKERPVENHEEILGETRKDETMIADDITNKEIPEAENLSTADLHVTPPSVKETFLEGTENKNDLPMLESGYQVHEASEVPREEEKHANDTYGASKSPESNILENKSTEETFNMEVTSTRSAAAITLEKGCELISEDELKELRAEENIKEEIEQSEKAADAEFQIPTKCDDKENSTIKEESPEKNSTPRCTGEGKYHDQEVMPNSSKIASPALDSGDQSCSTSNEIKNIDDQIPNEEAHEDHKVADRGEDTEDLMENEAHTVANHSPEPTGEHTTKCSQENETEVSYGHGTAPASTTTKACSTTDVPPSSIGEEKVEESLKEDKEDEMKSEKEVPHSNIECIEQACNAAHSTEEREGRALKHEAEPNEDLNAESITESSSEETTLRCLDLVENSSSVPEICDKEIKEEVLEKEDSNILVVAEETSLTEAEGELIMGVDRPDLVLEEKGLVPTETSEMGSTAIDLIAKAAENNEMEIPTARKNGADEPAEKAEPEGNNQICAALSTSADQRNVATVETSLDDASEQQLQESSILPLEEHNLVSPEIGGTTGETPQKEKTSYEKAETPLVAETRDNEIGEIEDASSNPMKDTDTGSIDTGKEREDDYASVEDREFHTPLEQNIEKSTTESDVELLKRVNTTEVAHCSETIKLETVEELTPSENKKSEYETATNETSEGVDVCVGCMDTEKAVCKQEDSAKNLKGSSKESDKIENAPVEFEKETQGSEASETKSISTVEEKSINIVEHDETATESIEKDEDNRRFPESNPENAEEESHDDEYQIIDSIDKQMNGQDIQEGKKEINEEMELKLETQKETSRTEDSILTEKVSTEIESAHESEVIKEQITEEESCSKELDGIPVADETLNEVTDPELTPIQSLEATASKKNAEMRKSNIAEDLNFNSETTRKEINETRDAFSTEKVSTESTSDSEIRITHMREESCNKVTYPDLTVIRKATASSENTETMESKVAQDLNEELEVFTMAEVVGGNKKNENPTKVSSLYEGSEEKMKREKREDTKNCDDETDIATTGPTVVTDLTSLGELQLNDEHVKALDTSSDAESLRTTKTADASQWELEETSVMESQLPRDELEDANNANIPGEKSDANDEVEATEIPDSVPRTEDQTVKDIHDTGASLNVIDTDTEEIEKQMREVPEVLSESTKQYGDAARDDEITHGQTQCAEKIEEKLQVSSFGLLSKKQESEAATRIEKGSTHKDGMEKAEIRQAEVLETNHEGQDTDEILKALNTGSDTGSQQINEAADASQQKLEETSRSVSQFPVQEHEKAENISATVNNSDAHDVEVEEVQIPGAVPEPKDLRVEEIHETGSSLPAGGVQANETTNQNRELPEEFSEATNQGVEAVCEDEIIAPAVTTEVTSSEEVQLHEKVENLDAQSRAKCLDTIKTAVASQQDAEIENMKHEETCAEVSRLPTDEHEEADNENIPVEKAEKTDVESEETKIPATVPELEDQAVKEIHETGTSLDVGDADTKEIEKQIIEAPETLSDAINQRVDAARDDESTNAQTLRDEKLEQQLQAPFSGLLTKEQESETSTTNEKGSTDKDGIEETKMLQAEIREDLDSTSEGKGIEYQVQSEEKIVQNWSAVSSAEELDTKSSKDDAIMIKTSREEVLETNHGYQDTDESLKLNTSSGTGGLQTNEAADASQHELEETSSMVSRFPVHKHEKAENMSATVDKYAYDVEVKEFKIPGAIPEPEDQRVHDIQETGTSLPTGEAHTNETTNQNRELPEAFSEAINQGVQAVSEDEIIAPAVATEVTSLEEVHLNEEVENLDAYSLAKNLDTIKTADASQQDAEFENMKLQETCTVVSQLPTDEHEEADNENISVEKAEQTDVEREQTKIHASVPEFEYQAVKEIHETPTSLDVGDADTNEDEKPIVEAPETLLEPINQRVDAARDVEITSAQTLRDEKLEQQLQAPFAGLLSKEQESETSTINQKESTDKDGIGGTKILQAEIREQLDSTSEGKEIEYQEQRVQDWPTVSSAEELDTKSSTDNAITTKMSREEVLKTNHGGRETDEPVKALNTSSDAGSLQTNEAANASQQELEETSSMVSQIPVHDEKAENLSATVDKSDEYDVEVKELGIPGAVSEAKDQRVEEIHETVTSLPAGEPHTNEIANQNRELPEAFSEAINHGVEAVSENEIIAPAVAMEVTSSGEVRLNERVENLDTHSHVKETELPGAVLESKDQRVKEIQEVHTSVEETQINEMEIPIKEVREDLSEDINQGVEPFRDVEINAPSLATNVTSLGELKLNDEQVEPPDTIKTADASQEEAKLDGMKREETSVMVSQLPKHEHGKAESENTHVEKPDAYDVEVEVEETEIPDTMPESEDQAVKEIHETSTSLTDGGADTNEIEKQIRGVSEALPKPMNPCFDTSGDDEMTPVQTLQAEKIEEQLQVPSFGLLSKEEDGEISTAIEKRSTDKDGTEIGNLRLQQNSAMVSQLPITTKFISADNVIEEKPDTDDVELKETTTLGPISEIKDRGFEIRVNPAAENTERDKVEEEVKEVTENIHDLRYQGVDAATDGENLDHPLPVGKLQDQSQLSSASHESRKVDEKSQFEEATDMSKFPTTECKILHVTGAIEKSEADEVQVEEAKTSEAISESKGEGVEEIKEIGSSPPVGKTHTGEIKEETKAGPESIFEPTYQGAETAIDGEIAINQTITTEGVEQLQEPKSTTEKPYFKDEGQRELEVSNLELKVQKDSQDRSPDEETKGLEKGSTDSPSEYVEGPIQDSSREASTHENIICSKNSNNDADTLPLPYPTVTELSTEDIGGECEEESNLKFEKNGRVLESVPAVNSLEVPLTSEGIQVIEENPKQAIIEMGDGEKHCEETTEEEAKEKSTSNEEEAKEKSTSKEKGSEEMQGFRNFDLMSLQEETATNTNHEDELRVEDYPGERTGMIFEASRNEIQHEMVFEESEETGAEKSTEETDTADNKCHSQVPVEDEIANVTPPKASKDGQNIQKTPDQSEVKSHCDETNFTDTITEATTQIKQLKSFEVMSVSPEEERTGDNDEEIAISKDGQLQKTDLTVPALVDAAEEAPDEKEVETFDGFSEPVLKGTTHGIIEPFEHEKEIATAGTNKSESHMDNEKLGHTLLEPACKGSGGTEDLDLNKKDGPTQQSISSPTATSQETIADKERKEAEDTKQHGFIFDKPTAEPASIPEEENSFQLEEHTKDKEPAELSTMGDESKLDKANIHIMAAVEEKETQQESEKPKVFSHTKHSENKLPRDEVVTNISEGVQGLEQTALAIPQEQIASITNPSENTELTNPVASKDVPLIQDNATAKTIKNVEEEDIKPGHALGSEPEAECEEENRMGEESEETTETTEKSQISESSKMSLSDLLQRSTKQKLQVVEDLTEERELMGNKEEPPNEIAETVEADEAAIHEKKDEEQEGDEQKREDSGSDAPVMVEASRDMDVKMAHKKSHNILSGVGSKVKHSLAKVKKAITGKSSHPKPTSPKKP